MISKPPELPVLDYRRAIEPWAKKAAREGRVINHVKFVGGHVEVTTIAKHQAKLALASEDAPEPKARGLLI